jgi:hypothetical protein
MNDLIPSLLWLACVVCPLAAILFIARLVTAPFSAKVSEQIKKHPWTHLVWGFSALLGVLVVFGLLDPAMWPPISVERREQRAKIMVRVQSAGGWDAVRRDCIVLAGQHTNGFNSHWRDTNALPTAIAALRPLTVQYAPSYGCVRMRIFGRHSTGGHSTPYFGLEVDTSTNSAGYQHGKGYDNGGVIGNHHSVAEQVAEGVYAIY